MQNKFTSIISWLIVAWMCYIFLGSLPYKFTNHPDTVHIFSTIGNWLSNFLGEGVGQFFSNYAAFVIGGFELLTSIILLAPAFLWLASKLNLCKEPNRKLFHRYGGLMASAVMAGAVFFHLFSPLGVEVLHQGESDGGSLFYSAASILLLGIVLFFLNKTSNTLN